jgi:hypothetical protein
MKAKKKKKPIKVSARQANLKRRLRKHLSSVGFKKGPEGCLEVSGSGKDVIRSLHRAQRNAHLREHRNFISERLPILIRHFASGTDLDPPRITPVIERIKSNTWQSDLFRLASLTWAVPVSNGFGRRLRYLVWDDPPFGLPPAQVHGREKVRAGSHHHGNKPCESRK